MKKEVRRCKYLIPLENGIEIPYYLKTYNKALELTFDLRAEIKLLANLSSHPKAKAIFEKEVGHLTDLLIALNIYNERIITNITTEEVDE